MKLIIAGGRDIKIQPEQIQLIMDSLGISSKEVVEVVSGTCRGADASGEQWAIKMKKFIKRFAPDWDTHGRAAGPIRNRQMANHGDALLLLWDGKSRGSANMKKEMEKLGKPVFEAILTGEVAQ